MHLTAATIQTTVFLLFLTNYINSIAHTISGRLEAVLGDLVSYRNEEMGFLKRKY